MKSESKIEELLEKAGSILAQNWNELIKISESKQIPDCLDDPKLVETIKVLVNSPIKSYRYVLPTQIVAKLANPSLDCRCLQAGSKKRGAFDARSIAHKIIVPFDQQNQNVLGGSSEPYVNNPLRVQEISKKFRKAQKNKEAWDRLCDILNQIEKAKDENFTKSIFKQVLTEIYKRLGQTRVPYPVPIRVSLDRSSVLIEDFLKEQSGGDRLLAIVSALFATIGRRFGMFAKVNRANITASDAATGMIADLECLTEKGVIVFAVEVKDRKLTVRQLTEKIPNFREKDVSEAFFIVTHKADPEEEKEISSITSAEFTSGHNIYISELSPFLRTILSLFKEEGRQEFLKEVGLQLDKYSDIHHRKAWADLLRQL